MCEFAYFALCKSLRNVAVAQYFSAFIKKLNINTGSKYYMFVSFIKHVPFQLVWYLFINQIYEKK